MTIVIFILKGYYLLLLCSTETSANSYYGDTTLHSITPNGESQIVQLSENFENKKLNIKFQNLS